MSARGHRGRNDAVRLAGERARGGPGRSDGRAPGSPARGRGGRPAARLARAPARPSPPTRSRSARARATLGDVWDSGTGAVDRVGQRPVRRPCAPERDAPVLDGPHLRRATATRASTHRPPPSAPRSSRAGRRRRSGPTRPSSARTTTSTCDFTVTTVAAGIKFRVNGSNAFMWQIRGDSSNELRPHVQVNGTYSQLKAVRLPMTIGLNTKHHARINVVGSTIRTYIDDVLVDTTVDTRNPNGSIGFRHGNTESARFDNVKVTSTGGATSTATTSARRAPTSAAARSPAASSSSAPRATARTASRTTGRSCARRFRVADKPIAWATAYVSARSTEPARQYVFKLSLNGKVVGVGPTRAINNATQTMYNAYDVTDLLRRGRQRARRARLHDHRQEVHRPARDRLRGRHARGRRLRHVVEGARGRGRASAGRQRRHELLRRAGREHRRAQVPVGFDTRRVRRRGLERSDREDRDPGPHRHARRQRRAAPARAGQRRQDRRQALLRRLRPHGRRRRPAEPHRHRRRDRSRSASARS